MGIPPDQPNSPYYQPDGSVPQARSGPKMVWKESWGAIVVDDHASKTGTATDKKNKQAAIDDALHQCHEKGGTECKVLISYGNACAAVASGHGGYGTSSRAGLAEAESSAVNECTKVATGKCEVVYSACSLAKQVRAGWLNRKW